MSEKIQSQEALCDLCGWHGPYPRKTGVCPSCRRGMDVGNIVLAMKGGDEG